MNTLQCWEWSFIFRWTIFVLRFGFPKQKCGGGLPSKAPGANTHTCEENMQMSPRKIPAEFEPRTFLLRGLKCEFYFEFSTGTSPRYRACLATAASCAPTSSSLLYELRVTKEKTTGGRWVSTQQARQKQEETEPLCFYSLQNLLNTWFNVRGVNSTLTLRRCALKRLSS